MAESVWQEQETYLVKRISQAKTFSAYERRDTNDGGRKGEDGLSGLSGLSS